MADSIFVMYLLWISCQDIRELQVVRYSHLLGILAVMWKILSEVTDSCCFTELCITGMILAVIQYISCYVHLYGVADGIAFFVCSMFLATDSLQEIRKGDVFFQGLTTCFMMQALAGVLVLVVQSIRKNIHGMSFREPVAYIPYISVAFFLTKWVL